MKPGASLKSIYKKCAEFVRENFKGVEVPKSFGYGTGVFPTEESLEIEPSNKNTVKVGQVYQIVISLINLEAEDHKSQKFAIQLADAIAVRESGIEVMTKQISI